VSTFGHKQAGELALGAPAGNGFRAYVQYFGSLTGGNELSSGLGHVITFRLGAVLMGLIVPSITQIYQNVK
jgi:hypothetical protein